MRRLAGLLLILATGCSTSPLAGFLDAAFPAKKIPPNTPGIFGGVEGPQPAPPPQSVFPAPATDLPGIPVPGTRP